LDGINILLEYFECFKEFFLNKEDANKTLKEIDKIISILTTTKDRSDKISYLVDYNQIEKIINEIDTSELLNILLKKYNTTIDEYKDSDKIPTYVKDMIGSSNKGIDNVLYDVMLNINRYNVYYMNIKVRNTLTEDNLDNDLPLMNKINVKLKDILYYLEVDATTIDPKLLYDINKYEDTDKLYNRAIELKSGIGFMHFIYDRLKDKEVLLTILLHSSDETINNVKEVFDRYNVNMSKVIDSIPSIFIKEPINSKCKYRVLENYNNFMNNVKLIEENSLDFKRMVNFPVFLVNDSENNRIILEKFKSMNLNVKNIYEHVGSIVAINPSIVFNNIEVLKLYGIELTDDNNNNGYTLLGMKNLCNKLDYLIEKGLWKKSDGINLDNIDLIRGLIIKDDYLCCKNNIKCDKLDITSHEKKFKNEMFNEERLNHLYKKYPEIKKLVVELDNKYFNFEEGYYVINGSIISRNRLLRNLSNYASKADSKEILFDSLNYCSNSSEEINEDFIDSLEMGGTNVKLS